MKSIRNKEGHWINTQVFREEAMHFLKYGYYTADPWGTPDWKSYWEEQLRRCREGYEVGGARITGHHYFYLNFCMIMLTEEGKVGGAANKVATFPHFWDGDFEYFHLVEIARHGISKKGLDSLFLETSPLYLDGGRHMIVGKARRKGFSYKNGAICANTYNTVRDSTTVIGAFDKKYLVPKGTMTMSTNYLNFLNEHTGWAKKRDYVDGRFHVRASFEQRINGMPIEKGYKSDIIGVTFKDNPDAARGKDATLILMEEAGKFPNLKDSYLATKPTLEDGAYTTGQIIIFGTGGDMEKGTVDFAEMFYNPNDYRLLPFENIWDEGAQAACGYFVPDFKNKPGFIDGQGNSDKEGAKQFELDIRKGLSGDGFNGHIQEYPFKPSEAFLVSSYNDFPVQELQAQLTRVKTNDLFKKAGQPVHLYRDENGVQARPDLKGELMPITKFPWDKKNLKGAPIIYEYPLKDPPPGLYRLGYDPYRQDQSSGVSLGAVFVYKASNTFSYTRDMIVAEYVGRPATTSDFNSVVEMLSELYGNAPIMYENEVTSVKTYFERRKKLHLLARQPDNVIKANVKNSSVARVYGIHMNEKLKDAAEKYIKQWLLEERDTDENGNKLLNLHFIYSIPLLEELIKYDRKKGNYDRVMALAMILFSLQEDEEGKTYDNDPRSRYEEELVDLMKTKYSR